jgi:uncharacterized protein YpmB
MQHNKLLFWVCLLIIIISFIIAVFFLFSKEKYNKRTFRQQLLIAQEQNKLNKIGEHKYKNGRYNDTNKRRKAIGQI